jgi:hypothetical protein
MILTVEQRPWLTVLLSESKVTVTGAEIVSSRSPRSAGLLEMLTDPTLAGIELTA